MVGVAAEAVCGGWGWRWCAIVAGSDRTLEVGTSGAMSTAGDAGDDGGGAMGAMSTAGAGRTGAIWRVVSGRTIVPMSLTWKFMTPKVTVIPALGGVSVDGDRRHARVELEGAEADRRLQGRRVDVDG